MIPPLQGHKEWITEVDLLGVVDHPNLVKLIGYCAEDDERGIQRLLMYEYMPNGSVFDHLSRSTDSLPWATRLRVALDAARGLAYLHEEMDFQVVYFVLTVFVRPGTILRMFNLFVFQCLKLIHLL